MLFVNFKTYERGTGQKAVELVRTLSQVSQSSNVPIIPVVQVADVRLCVGISTLDVWVQHVDNIEPGQHTGWILPEAVAAAGAKGTFLNHSEHRLDSSLITYHLSLCRKAGLKTMVFAANLNQLRKVVELKPDFVSYEPPELIASKETSVARARPEVIEQAAEIAKKAGIPLIVGAGVKDVEDVKGSLRAGAVGVAVSSAVVLAENSKIVIQELVRGFTNYDL